MKNLYVFICLISFSICSAQDPQLFDNTWYLHNVIIDDQNNTPPSNSEVPFVPLEFYENPSDSFMTTVCNSLLGTLMYNGNQNFTIQYFGLTLIFCDSQENSIFEGIYLSIFFDSNTQEPYSEPFSYTIVLNGNEKTLIIENVNGDQAIYGNVLLSAQNFENKIFSFYPNPAKNKLIIGSNQEIENLNIKIFNIEGKLLSTQSLDFEKEVSLDVSNLSNGIYFLNIEDKSGNTTVKKFIKE